MTVDTPDFGPTGYARTTAEGAAYLDAALSDILSELQSINIHQANIANATLAIDLPKRYRSGVAIFAEQFEYDVQDWHGEIYGAGAASARSTAHWYSKGASWLLTTGSTLAKAALAYYQMGRYPQAKIGLEVCFTVPEDLYEFRTYLRCPYNDNYYEARFSVYPSLGKVSLWQTTASATTVSEDWEFHEGEDVFHFFKLVFDLTTGKYVVVYLDDLELDVSAYSLINGTGQAGKGWRLYFSAMAAIAANLDLYFDDVCLTEED